MIRSAVAITALLGAAACGNSRPGAPIAGHAVLRGVTDHSGTTVTLSDGDANTVTDSYGYFFLPGIPRGDYLVTATRDGTYEREVSVHVAHDGVAASSALLVLSPFGRVTGTVTDPDGGPIQFATVDILGTDVSTTSVEGGRFVIDPAPAGDAVLTAAYGDFEAGKTAALVPVGGTVEIALRLGPDTGPGLYGLNRVPEVTSIRLEALPDLSFPRVIPLVDTAGQFVRRGGSYRLSIDASDADADPVTVYWSADRGTLESTIATRDGDTYSTLWRAAAGVSTLTCTAIDPLGGSATARLVVEATGDGIRGGGRRGNLVYYSERRADSFDLYSYDFVTGDEARVDGDALEQHAATVLDNWLVYGDSEFVFIGTLVYRLWAENLTSGVGFSFGQPFDHDSYFVMRLDLYTPLASPWVPYHSSDANLAPPTYGYLDLNGGAPVQPPGFATAEYGPANLRAFARDQGRDIWVSSDGRLWVDAGAGPIDVATVPGDASYPYDVQLQGSIAAALPQSGGPLYWLDLDAGGSAALPHAVGRAVTSFAVHGDHLAYVERGPTSASVELLTLSTGATRTLTPAPHFARRIFYLDDEYVMWGDQGAEGQAFVALNTELLWIDRL